MKNKVKGEHTQEVLKKEITSLKQKIKESDDSLSEQLKFIDSELDEHTKNSEDISKLVSNIYCNSKIQCTELINRNKSSINEVCEKLRYIESITVPKSSKFKTEFVARNKTLQELEELKSKFQDLLLLKSRFSKAQKYYEWEKVILLCFSFIGLIAKALI